MEVAREAFAANKPLGSFCRKDGCWRAVTSGWPPRKAIDEQVNGVVFLLIPLNARSCTRLYWTLDVSGRVLLAALSGAVR